MSIAALLGALLLALLPPVLATGAAQASGPAAATASLAATQAARKQLALYSVSNRPDLVSGGDVRVALGAVRGLRRATVRVSLNGRDVTRRFAVRPGGRFEGLVSGLRLGRNVISARAPGHTTGRLVVTNHPSGGPVFSGPQHGPYQCQRGARDAQCNQPATYDLLYRSTDPAKRALLPYDPRRKPRDVATTLTDEGVRVPFVVRQEQGYLDRDHYTILTLFRPGQPWSPYAPQRQFNHKLVIPHGGGCGASYAPSRAPLVDYVGTDDADEESYRLPSYLTALGRGFAVLSTALDNTGHNCNLAMQAESLMMAKERFVERYGTIRYTMGTGCSGGSIAQHTVANAYPGIYQGLVTTCSFPDVMSLGASFVDYRLLRLYFSDPSRWGEGVEWTADQVAEVEGRPGRGETSVVDDQFFQEALDPDKYCSGTRETVPRDRTTRYDARTNPAGVRCSALAMMIHLLGPRERSVWARSEQDAGRGFAGLPFANAGVQYGLGALRSGRISVEQFVDLNTQLGGLSVDADPTDARTAGDPASISRAYRTGLLNEANHLDGVAMINFGGPDPGVLHDHSRAFWTEDRLTRDQGHSRNRVMWFGRTPLIGDPGWANEALLAMDRWLTNVERDRAGGYLSEKVARSRPTDVVDRCASLDDVRPTTGVDGQPVCVPTDEATRLSSPREVSGDDRFNDRLSCRLRPVERSDYDAVTGPVSDEQWVALQPSLETLFPEGVCDYSQPGVGQGPAQTWLTYSASDGGAIVGGANLPKVAPSQGSGAMGPAFRGLLQQ